jgi:hypothetical protein
MDLKGLPRPFQLFLATVFTAMITSELGFLFYGAMYWGQIRNVFSSVEHAGNCHLETLVTCAQHLWILSLIAPGLAPVASAASILQRTHPAACAENKKQFVLQANNEFCALFYAWRNQTAVSVDPGWEREPWFDEWFRARCNRPFAVVAVLLALAAYALLAVAGTLAALWATTRWARPPLTTVPIYTMER